MRKSTSYANVTLFTKLINNLIIYQFGKLVNFIKFGKLVNFTFKILLSLCPFLYLFRSQSNSTYHHLSGLGF